MRYLEERGRKALELAKSLERSDIIDARDFAHQVYFCVNTAEGAQRKQEAVKDATEELRAELRRIADTRELWDLMAAVERKVAAGGPSAITDEDVVEAFLIQRRLRKRLHAALTGEGVH